MNKVLYGYISATSGALIWGVVPLYYNLLNEFAFIEVVVQRIFWACIIFAIVFIFQKRFSEIGTALCSVKNLILFLIKCTKKISRKIPEKIKKIVQF